VKPEFLITLSALIAVFAGLFTVVVATRKRRDRAEAAAAPSPSPDSQPKD